MPPTNRRSIAVVALAAFYPQTEAFQSQPTTLRRSDARRIQHHGADRCVETTTLFAKTKYNKNSKKNTSSTNMSGGFGKVSAAAAAAATPKPKSSEDKIAPNEDYAVFPALDPQVAETLITAPMSLQEESGFLPAEIYDRLDQIYGFPNFNYETLAEYAGVEEEELSLGDLLSATPSSQTTTATTSSSKSSSSSSSSMSDLDFADLLSAATGGKIETTLTTTTSVKEKAADSKIDITKLPPFEKLRVLHVDPLVLAIDDFFTEEECDRYVDMSLSSSTKTDDGEAPQLESFQTRSKTVGKDAAAKSQRTSTTWFHHYKNVPELMAKATRLVGLDTLQHWEEPQTVRYRSNEKFTWHLDALAPQQATSDQGGQRLATLLVYLKDLEQGGATIFRDLQGLDGGPLKVQPRKGSALMFFPAAGGIPNTPFDIRTLHCGEIVPSSSSTEKWISQLWLRETKYTPSAPPGNLHAAAKESVESYCYTSSSGTSTSS